MNGSLALSLWGMVLCAPSHPIKQVMSCLKTRGHLCPQGAPLPTGSTSAPRQHLCPQGAPLTTGLECGRGNGSGPTPHLTWQGGGVGVVLFYFLEERQSVKEAGRPAWLGSSQSRESSDGADLGVNSRWRTLPSPPANSLVNAVVSQVQKERATTHAHPSIRGGDDQVRDLGWRRDVRSKGKG